MAKLYQKKIVSIKLESSIGVPETSLDVIHVDDVSVSFNVVNIENIRNGDLGIVKNSIGSKAGTITITIPIHGRGEAGTPIWADLLECTGFAKSSQAYTLGSVEANQKTATIWVYTDGIVHKFSGCMGNPSISMQAASKGQITLTMQGSWYETTTAALPSAATFISPPIFKSGTLTLDAYSPLVDQVSIDIGNTLILRPSVGTASGISTAWITARKPTITLAPETSALATYDPWAQWLASTSVDFQAVLGGTANNIITIDCPAIQLTGANPQDRSGLLATAITADVLNDNMTITFS